MKTCHQQKVLCNWGMTLKQSSAVHIQALVSADGILPGSSSNLRHLVINLASVPGRQLVNSPTAQSLERCASLLQSFFMKKNTGRYLLLGILASIKVYLRPSIKKSL